MAQCRLDIRVMVTASAVVIIVMFYVLVSQYDESLFNSMGLASDLNMFIASNANIISATFQESIDLNLEDRAGADYVVVGFCCHTHTGKYDSCEPQKFVTDLAQGTFTPIGKRIIYQQCTKHGLPPYFMIDPYQDNDEVWRPNNVTQTDQVWYLPDILLCQGYFYDNKISYHREHSSATQIAINIEQQMQLYHHLDVPYDIDNYDTPGNAFDINHIDYAENLKYSIRLSRQDNLLWKHTNRSFLTTYNTEFWGGGRCPRYDIIFESVFDRTLHGCVTVYIPAAFYFESERMYNDTTQLILPHDVVFSSDTTHDAYLLNAQQRDKQITFSDAQQAYIDSITAFKENFALFLVRDCYKPKYHIDAVLRVIFFDLLSSQYKEATSLGGCRRNIKVYEQLGWSYCPKNSFDGNYINNLKYNCSGYGWTDGVVQMARPYKFFITFENSKIKGYSTEKIFNALYSNSVPIYFGDPMITQYLNKNKFIHCNTITDAKIKSIRQLDKKMAPEDLIAKVKPMVMTEMMECIEKVKAVDQNDQLWHRMLVEPVFVNNTFRNTVMDPQVIGDKLRYALKLHDSYLVT